MVQDQQSAINRWICHKREELTAVFGVQASDIEDRHISLNTRQPSDLTEVARGLPSGFKGSEIPWSNVFRHLKPRGPGKIEAIRQLDTW
jgi:hypothetical protein